MRKWYLRNVYDHADPQTEDGRKALLLSLGRVLWSQVDNGGRRLESASSGSTSSQYGWAEGMTLDSLTGLTEWARGYISEADVEDAVASVPPPVRYLSTSFTGLVH